MQCHNQHCTEDCGKQTPQNVCMISDTACSVQLSVNEIFAIIVA